MKEKIIAFVKKETVLVVAAILAVISAFFAALLQNGVKCCIRFLEGGVTGNDLQ